MQIRKLPFVAICSAFFFCSSAIAEECKISKYRCENECTNLNTTDRGFCYRDKQSQAEIKLQATYDHLIPLAKKWDSELVKSLRIAQKSWTAFRELNCKVYDITEMELRGARKDDCILRMTRERINELESIEADIER